MLNSLSNPLSISNNSTGQIKWLQIVCSLISLQIILLSYLFLKLGYAPEVVFVINFLVMCLETFAKLLFAKRQIGLSLAAYLQVVVIRSIMVLLVSMALSYLLFPYFSNDLLPVIFYMFSSALVVLAMSFFFGLDKTERDLVVTMVKKYTAKNRK